jgi:hypothetical protein
LRGSILHFFQLGATQGLVEAEPLLAETVVYAEVQEDEVSVFCSLELFVYSLLIIFVGIVIGRITAPSTSADFV